jgi:DNA-binding transcriptional LysR family regulator
VLVATPKYLSAHGVPKHYTDLEQHALLRVKFLNGNVRPWLFKPRGAAQTVAFEGQPKLLLSDPDVMLDAVLHHLGIASLGRYHVHEALEQGELVLVLAHQFVRGEAAMSLFYPHRKGLAPRVRVLVDYLIAHLPVVPSLAGG